MLHTKTRKLRIFVWMLKLPIEPMEIEDYH